LSWVTDVLVLCSLEESLSEKGFVLPGQGDPLPFLEANEWLAERDLGALECFSQHLTGGRKAFQSPAYGAAINRLPVADFLSYIRGRAWANPNAVQVLIREEEQEVFTLHSVGTAL
jgi:hypothetical protein